MSKTVTINANLNCDFGKFVHQYMDLHINSGFNV